MYYMNNNPIFNFHGKNILITGGANGLGEGFARAFARARGYVIIADVDFDAALKTATDIQSTGGRAYPVQVDVSKKESIIRMLGEIISKFKKIDILMNNAGINIRKPAINFSEEDWDKIISVNLKGAFFVAQEVGKKMLDQRNGKIINTSSDGAFLVTPNLLIYQASKAGVSHFTKVLAKEWAPYQINVNAIAPGYVITEMTKEFLKNKKIHNELLKKIPLGRFATIEDISGVALFLASNLADYITGQTILVEGGRVLY
jgi:2-deoxy-D-gluconate 3-dehydrogenase